MNAELRRRLEMAVRVRDFLRAHRTEGAGDGTAVTRLEELVGRAEVLAAQQRAGMVASHASTLQRREVRRTLTKRLRYLAAVGAVAAKDNPELAAQFPFPRNNTSDHNLLTAARGMLEKATAQNDLLVTRGMSETLLNDLAAAIAGFEQTLEAKRAGRREHVGASADLRAVFADIVEQVRLVDALVQYRFGDNPELMGAWTSARNVLGPFRSRGEEETLDEGGPSEIAPAA